MDYSINFHQTFAPEKEAIAQLVQFASINNEYFSKEEISAMTAIPTGDRSGKVVPHILYSEAMGLISVSKEESNYSLTLTPLGEVVNSEDPFLMEDITQWLCHYNLARIGSPAALWSYIFNSIIYSNGMEFTNQSLVNALTRKFDTNKINVTPFRTCYTAEKCFRDLNILDITEEKYYFKQHNIDRAYRYFYAYILLNSWERTLLNQSEITYENLLSDIGFGGPFLWDEKSIMEVLEIFHEERLIFINRQLSPITLIKQVSSDLMLSKMYSFLL
ncbi:DUF4007 family protein [Neobacillus sp. SCS-31]|uniref:DUF4007 family protein n=1 Tax=Neobacillus oceani TaxID=3115292 RepID=UPI0039060E58